MTFLVSLVPHLSINNALLLGSHVSESLVLVTLVLVTCNCILINFVTFYTPDFSPIQKVFP